jgi:hypothetical protein
MATKKTPVEPKGYPMTRDEIEGMNAMADSMDLKEAAKKAKAATPQDVPEKMQPEYDPYKEIGTGILIDGKKAKDKGSIYTLGGGRQVPVKPNEELYYDKEKSAYATRTKKMAKGGVTRADGCITKGRTKGRIV